MRLLPLGQFSRRDLPPPIARIPLSLRPANGCFLKKSQPVHWDSREDCEQNVFKSIISFLSLSTISLFIDSKCGNDHKHIHVVTKMTFFLLFWNLSLFDSLWSRCYNVIQCCPEFKDVLIDRGNASAFFNQYVKFEILHFFSTLIANSYFHIIF